MHEVLLKERILRGIWENTSNVADSFICNTDTELGEGEGEVWMAG